MPPKAVSPPLQSGSSLQDRSSAALRVWLVAFPALGGIILGVVARRIWQQGAALTIGEWFSFGFTIVLGLLITVLPPSIARRELQRRRLEREEEPRPASEDSL